MHKLRSKENIQLTYSQDHIDTDGLLLFSNISNFNLKLRKLAELKAYSVMIVVDALINEVQNMLDNIDISVGGYIICMNEDITYKFYTSAFESFVAMDSDNLSPIWSDLQGLTIHASSSGWCVQSPIRDRRPVRVRTGGRRLGRDRRRVHDRDLGDRGRLFG